MSHLRKSVLSPGSSRAGSRVSSRSNSKAPPLNRMMSSSTVNDSDDEQDFSFSGLDDLIVSRLQQLSTASSVADPAELESPGAADQVKTSTSSGHNILTTHSIQDLFQSLSMSRTDVSTESREAVLARMYHLMISKPLISQPGVVNEFDAESLIKYYQNARTEAEKLLSLKVITTYCCSDIEEVSTLVISELLPVFVNEMKQTEAIVAVVRANVMICYASFLLCIYDGSGAYGLDATMESILELLEGLSASQAKSQEVDVIINGLHTVGVILTVLYHGDVELNELIEDLVPRLIVFLEDDNLDISKASGRVIALVYELYNYGDDEDGDEDEDGEFAANPYYDFEQLQSTVESLAKTSSKSVNKKAKKEAKSVFRDISSTLVAYSNKDSREELYKNPLTLTHLKISKSRSLAIQSWYSLIRLIHLRFVFNAGLHDNLAANAELNNLIKKPKGGDDKYAKFDKSYDDNEEETNSGYGVDYKRKITTKKKDIQINKARMEKRREGLDTLATEETK